MNVRDKFLLAKMIKNELKGVNFINLKTLGGYIAKSKSQGVCLQLTQALRSNYIIWPKNNLKFTKLELFLHVSLLSFF